MEPIMSTAAAERPDVAKRVKLLAEAGQGRLDDLPCPECGRSTVSVWFDRPTANDWETWFLCEPCGFELVAQNTGRPAHYSGVRDLSGFVK
jgi:hypothetical protein